MLRLLKDRSGAAALEFGLAFLPFITLILGILQVGYLLWIDGLLHYAVNEAARCGAVGSTTYPCAGSGVGNMVTAADSLFGMAVAPIPNGTFGNNSNCTGSGLTGSYSIRFLLARPVTINVSSCYPNYP
jgi:Flp pilus assembly protein TadG